MNSTAINPDWLEDIPLITGKAPICRSLFHGENVSALFHRLLDRVSSNLEDAAAFMDVSLLLRAAGMEPQAEQCQAAALEMGRQFLVRNGDGSGPTVLVFVTAGDFMANTPIEFLTEYSNCNLVLFYVDAQTVALGRVPRHDVAFVAIGESPENVAVLQNLERLLAGWQGPILNNTPQRIIALSRDGVADAFANDPFVLAPATARVTRADVEALASERRAVGDHLSGYGFPVILRPVGSHAGKGMEKLDTPQALFAYLAAQPDEAFYLSPYINYASPDGKFRKQRIVFINGRAYPSHYAVSDHWMVHYLSAGMLEHPDRREEEEAWMDTFDSGFARRHAHAFDALYRRLGLDYFAIDCAEMADGRLLLFEADVAMIVHAMDREDLFPYKQRSMRRLFAAFERALRRQVERIEGTGDVTCAHSGKPAVYQRNDNDCLICALAMYLGKSYDEIQDLARQCDPAFPLGGPMSHSIMRGVANRCGTALLSSIYMLWNRPAIIGVVSPTSVDTGHAVFWDGEKLIDPGHSDRVDRAYVDRCGLEFTQRASDLQPLIAHDEAISYQATATAVRELV